MDVGHGEPKSGVATIGQPWHHEGVAKRARNWAKQSRSGEDVRTGWA